MDARAHRLSRFVRGDTDLAETLVAAGFDTPAKIKAASDSDLLSLAGVGRATLEKIRARMPKV